MKKLKLIYKEIHQPIQSIKNGVNTLTIGHELDTQATLQTLCDAVNELSDAVSKSGLVNPKWIPETKHVVAMGAGGGRMISDMKELVNVNGGTGHGPKRFKAEEIERNAWELTFQSEAEAQAALEALLNI